MIWCGASDELRILIMLACEGMGNICCISGGLKWFSFQPSILKEKRSALTDCSLLVVAGDLVPFLSLVTMACYNH